jgi:tetratricopeptide (TPR) repeat protein
MGRQTTGMCLLACLALAAGACANRTPLGTLQERGDAAFARGDYAGAYEQYHQYVQRSQADPVVLHSMGRTLMELGRPGEAVTYLRLSHDLVPQVDRYLETLAEAMFQSGDREGLYRLLRAETANRGRVDDYIRLGTYAARLHDPDEAETALLQAALLDGGRTIEPQLALANFYSSIGDRERAVERLRMALWFDVRSEAVSAKLRALGEIPGPSLALPPRERSATAGVPARGG